MLLFSAIKNRNLCMHNLTHVKFWVTLKHSVPHWCTYWCTLLLQYLDKVKIFSQCIIYLLSILISNMHWLKYIWCKISIEQDLTLRALFTFFFSSSIYRDDFFVNFTDHFVPVLLESAASLSFSQLLILIGTFPGIIA